MSATPNLRILAGACYCRAVRYEVLRHFGYFCTESSEHLAEYVPWFIKSAQPKLIVARCDLKADRQRKVLMVQSAFLEPGQDARRVAPELAAELRQMQAWLGLDRIEVSDRGDLAARLRRTLR